METFSRAALALIAAALALNMIEGGGDQAKRWIGRTLTGRDVFGAPTPKH